MGAASLYGTEPPFVNGDDVVEEGEEDEGREGREGDPAGDSVGSSDLCWALQRLQRQPASRDHAAAASIGPPPADSVGHTAEGQQPSPGDAPEASPASRGSSEPTTAKGRPQRQKLPFSSSYGAGLCMLRTNARRMLRDASAHFVEGIGLENLSDNQVGGWGYSRLHER